MKIKAIAFDLGGVIIELDFSKFVKEIIEQSPLSKNKTAIMLEFFRQSDTYHQGIISDEEFYRFACDLLQVCVLNKEEFFTAFNSIVSGVNGEVVELIQNIRKLNSIKLVCISNINASHWKFLKEKNEHIFDLFDELVLSHKIKILKPDPRIFKYLLKKVKCRPGEVLYIDDGLNNVRSASNLGIKGIHYTNVDELKEELNVLNIKTD